MLRKFLYAAVSLVCVVGIVQAAYNLRQRSDGGAEWVQSKRGDAPIRFDAAGDINTRSVRVVWFDDFTGDVIADQFDVSSGTDAQAANAAVTATQAGGFLYLVSGNVANADMTGNGSSLTHELNWEADNGNLVFEARLTLDQIDNVAINVGFTDTKAATELVMPFEMGGAAVTGYADDAVGWVFDTDGDPDNWHCVGVKAKAESSAINSGVAPVVDTYQVLRLEINASGHAECFIDGTSYGVTQNAVTVTANLTPMVVIMTSATESRTVNLDYLFVGMDR